MTSSADRYCEKCGEALIRKVRPDGKPEAMARFLGRRRCSRKCRRPQAQRFWSKVDMRGADECWRWTGAINDKGYGVLRPEGRHEGPALRAHRIAAELAGMDIDGVMVLHSCDNRLCCNPMHLRPGTAADNSGDAVERDRILSGQRQPNAKLTDTQAVEVFRRRHAGESIRRLAAEFGVTDATVVRIAKRQGWVRVTAQAAAEMGFAA